jgi:tetratricopeptide (TPR) repeat protein
MYRAVKQPRRIFSSLIQLTSHRIAQQDNVAAQESVNEARSLLRPDWPAEFLILLLRVDASIAEQTGRQEDATAMRREAVRVSVSSGDWRHEVIDRSNLVDSLWRTGPIEAAADEISRLAAEIRARPAPDSDMASLYANLIGVLSEMGRIDEATAAAREAIPVMRRSRYTYLEEWVYLFWRRGQLDTAALLLGACDEERRRFGTPHQENERRLVAAVRAGLETQLRPAVLASAMAAGAALDERDWLLVITAALELQTQRLMG